jgi:predicted GTPase
MSTPLVRELGLEETDAPIILVLGETGAGKSYFINTLVPGSVRIGYHSESCMVTPLPLHSQPSLFFGSGKTRLTPGATIAGTQQPQLVSARVNNREFLLVDTPGFNDTYRSDGQILAEIAGMLTLQKQLGVKLVR